MMKIRIGNGLIYYMIAYPQFRRTAEKFNKDRYWQQMDLRYRNDYDDIVNDHVYGYFLW